jgi:integrase
MGVYDRNKGIAGAKKNLWILYTITEEQRARHGLKTRSVRESAGDNQRAANALLAQRRREVRDDSWRPISQGGASGTTLAQYVEKWIAMREASGVRSIRNESQRLRQHVVPVLGDKRLTDVRRQDVRALVAAFQSTPSKATGKPPAPRMVHRVYEDLRTMLAHAAEVDEIIPASPCTLKVVRGELPKKRDADPRWRANAVFTRDEVEQLLSDSRIELPRRATYALMFLTGSRIGEVVGVHWKDYDPASQPLGRLVFATQHGGDELKTEVPREVPVHPVLASVLATWKLEGFELYLGRKPKPDDYIVPRLRTKGPNPIAFQGAKTVWRHLQEDLALLGHRPRRLHDSRRTLITLARADGARPDLLHFITHGPSASMMDLYSSPPWATLCEQISCLRISLRDRAVTPLRAVSSGSDR